MSDRILKRFIPVSPYDWKRVIISQCLEEVSKPIKMRDSEAYDLVSIRRRNGGMFHRETLHGRDILTKTLQEVVPFSFVIARMQVIHGATALASPKFAGAAISKSYSSFIGTPICDIKFFSWLAKHPLMYAYFADASQGVVIEKMTFDQNRWLTYPIFLPPLAEQRAIAEILDSADDAIRSTERLIAKLEQAKKGLLVDLLTRGIDESGRVRDLSSLVQTPLGLRPKSWTVLPVGKLLEGRPKNGYSPREVDYWTGTLMLGLGCLTPNGFRPGQLKNAPLRDAGLERAILNEGDLLISRANTRELVGLVGRFRGVGVTCTYPDLMMRLQPNRRVISEYLELALRAPSTRRQMQAAASGTSGSMVKISSNTVCNLLVAIPEKLEQQRIIQVLDESTIRVETEQQRLAKLRQLKQALMDDLLTGRVRVGASV